MPNYKFQQINGGVSVSNPILTICDVQDKRNGTAIIVVLIEHINPSPNFEVSFKVPLDNFFTYVGDQPMKADVDAWFEIEIQNYLAP